MHVVRNTFLFSTALVALFPSSVRLQATNQTVSATDSRISYVGDWTVQDGGGHMFTSVSGSFSLDFTGSAIYWYSRKLYDGAVTQITLDHDETTTLDLSDGMGQNDVAVVAVLYSKEGLNAGTSHSLSVTWEGKGSSGAGSFLENYYLVFTSGTMTTSSTSATSSTSSSTTVSSSSSSASSSSSTSSSSSSSPASSSSSSPMSSSSYSSTSGSSSAAENTSMLLGAKSSSDSSSTSDPTYTTFTSSGVTLTSMVITSSTLAATASHSNVGAIAGGVAGGIIGLFFLFCAILLCLRRRKSQTTSLHDMQSATPFHSLQDPTQPPIPPLISPSSNKQRLDMVGSMSASEHQEQDRLYVLVDPTYLTTLRSSGAAGPLSPAVETPSSSSAPFETLRNWMRQRSETSQGTAGWRPQSNVLSPINIAYALRGDYNTSIPTTMALTPLSPHDAFDEPPPDYRN